MATLLCYDSKDFNGFVELARVSSSDKKEDICEEEKRIALKLLDNFNKVFSDELDIFCDTISGKEDDEELSLFGYLYSDEFTDIDEFRDALISYYQDRPGLFFRYLENSWKNVLNGSVKKTDQTCYTYCLIMDNQGIPLDIMRSVTGDGRIDELYIFAPSECHF